MTNVKQFNLELDWKNYQVETWKLAQQANGACTVRLWDTVMLVTATAKRKASDIDFLPLSINYQEKLYAAWKISWSRFIKRETRPSDDKILISRLLDRGIRPLLPKSWRFETQVMMTTLAYDWTNQHDILAWLWASISLAISDIPCISNVLVRVWMIDWEFIFNPTTEQRENWDLDLSITCTSENIVMIEAWANIIPENKMIEAMKFWHEKAQKLIVFIEKIAKEIWKEKRIVEVKEFDERIKPAIEAEYKDQIEEIIFADIPKWERFAAISDMSEEAWEKISAELNEWTEEWTEVSIKDVQTIFNKVQKDVIRYNILEKERRIKWRGLDEIRPLNCEVDLIPRVHGVWLFNRWETQWLSVVTLWWPWDKQTTNWVEWEKEKRYFHHYNFPPYSVWEVSNRLSTWNREIWHWMLAEKALAPVLPTEEEFPYTIRVVTEILSSNGSSSMAAACGSTLSLMDAWVPIKFPVSWIAMWLMTDYETWKYKVLTDLQDEEDFWWDMDFKVTWTKDWVTAIQMDIKLTWISMDIFEIAFEKARVWRLKVMDAMLASIPEVRKELKPTAPSLLSLQIDTDEIKIVIWKWGETIQRITWETWVDMNISDEWLIVITAENQESWLKAKAMVEQLLIKPEVWKLYDAEVVKQMDFWVFVRFMPWFEWLVHISAIKNERCEAKDLPKEWEKVKIKLMEIDQQWRYKLSMKDVI